MAGVLCYVLVDPGALQSLAHFSVAPILSTSAALLITPIVSLMFKRNADVSQERIWKAVDVEGDVGPDANPIDGERDTFHLVPRSIQGRFGMGLAIFGFLAFLTGVSGGIWAWSLASATAVGGMVTVFAGGLLRVYAE